MYVFLCSFLHAYWYVIKRITIAYLRNPDSRDYKYV